MKLVKNILTALVALPLVAGLASCSEKEAEYSPAEAIASDEVYFVSPTTTVEVDANKSVAYVNINRIKTADEIVVPLKVTSSNPKTIPATSVKFAAGDSVAQIAVNYDPSEIESGKFDTLYIDIASDDYTTPYGSSSVEVLFGKSLTWTTLGTGKFMDFFYDEENYYDVTIQRCDQDHNTYRVVDPYKDMELGHQGDDFQFTVYDKGDDLGGWTVPFDGFVYYEPCNSGYFYSTYGSYIIAHHPYDFSMADARAEYNRVEDYMDENEPGLIICSAVYWMPNYSTSGGGWDYSSYDAIQIIMPGYVMTDYSATVEYTGKFISTEDKVSAEANITLGSDVSYAKIGIAAGDWNKAAQDSIAANGTEIESSGEYKLALPENAETGKYTIYVVTFNDKAVEQNYGYDTFKYVAGDAAETWTPRYVGTWTYSLYAFCNEDGTPYEDKGLVLSQCDQDPTQWKIEHMWYDVTFYFSWDQTNNVISFEDQLTGANYGYGDIYAVDLSQYEGYDAGYYDQESGSFKFNIYYTDGNYNWGDGWETFTLTGYSEAAKRALAHKVAAKKHMTSKSKANAVPVKVSGLVNKGSGKVANSAKRVKLEKAPF